MWKRYFPRGHIYGIDVYDKRALQEPRITIFQGSQADPEFLRGGDADRDHRHRRRNDATMLNVHVIAAFNSLFSLLAESGIYVIEQTQTSYSPGADRPAAKISIVRTRR